MPLIIKLNIQNYLKFVPYIWPYLGEGESENVSYYTKVDVICVGACYNYLSSNVCVLS